MPQVQEAVSPLLCLQARSGTKHPRICSPLTAAALSHRELRYQHHPETDPPTAVGSQAGKALGGWPSTPGTPPLPLLEPALGKSELWALHCLLGAPQTLGSTSWGAPALGPALWCLLCPPLPRGAQLCQERGQGGLQLSQPLLPARSRHLGFHLGPGFAGLSPGILFPPPAPSCTCSPPAWKLAVLASLPQSSPRGGGLGSAEVGPGPGAAGKRVPWCCPLL